MAARTRLGLDGYGVRRTGSFSGKTPESGGGHPVARITQPQLGGWGGKRYGSFAGRSGGTHPVARITRMSLDGGYGTKRCGSFASKTPDTGGGTVIPVVMHDYRRRRV